MNRLGIPIVVALVPLLTFGKNATPIPKSVDPGWWSKAQQEIAAGEYRIGFQEKTGLWQSPNRAQNLRATYFDDGFSLKPRADSTETWNVEMRVLEVGKNGKPLVPQAHAPKALDKNGTRMTVSHPGFDIEYENGSEGMRQNFIVKQKPEGVGPLTVKMATSGLTALKKGLGDVVFSEKHPQNGDYRNKVWYKDLKAWDAEGKTLTAEMEVEEGELRLAVRDDGAVYPVTIDPLSTTANWTAESDQDSASLGYSLASAGDVNGDGYSDVIAGAYKFDNGNKDEGRTFLYLGGSGGLATTSTWSAECDQDSAYFGISVSSAGDVNGDGYSDVIVGALNYTGTVTAQSYEGGAFIYLGGSGGLSASPQRILESDQGSAWMGGSVASAGDVNGDGYSDVIVGTYGWTAPQLNEGKAQIFLGGSSGTAAAAAWSAESNSADAEYGWSVASAGDVNGDGYSDVIVGADAYGASFQGRAYVYYGSTSAIPMIAGPILTGSNQANAYFGISVAGAGDVNGDGYADAIVGAFGASNGQTYEGRAFVYHGGSGGLNTVAQWTAESNQANAYFGYSVASAGDVNGDGYAEVIVGAYSYDSIQVDGGMARLYPGGPTGLSTTPTWTTTGGQAGATFGTAVASAGDVNGDGFSDILVGADWYSNGQAREGRAFAYYGGSNGISMAANWAMESNQADAYFGYSVSGAGDVNGDGFSDVIVGALGFDNGESGEGRAFVYHGSAAGLSTTANWTGESNQASAQFGQSVSGAGDVNGDGFGDVIVGAPFYTHALNYEGRAYVYHGGSGGLAASPAWTAQGGLASSTFAQSVSGAGDVNGDGFGDIIVGQPNWTNGPTTAEGRVRVFLGRASGLDTAAIWSFESNLDRGNLGLSVSCAGDVNGDGFSDIIVGAPQQSAGGSGNAFVYHGGPGGVAATAAWISAGPTASSGYGSSVSSAGDFNGDGYSDVVVGAPTATQVRLYIGGPSGLATTPATTYSSGGGQFGISVAGAGDVNGDGYSDFVIGETGNPNQWARVYYGTRTGGTALPSTAILYAANLGQFGFSVAGAGDVNGDGYSDIIVGAPDYYGGLNREGRATVYYGNGGAGLRATPGQFRAGTTIPIAPVGVANPSGQVYLGMWMRSPLGRQKGKVMYEYRAQALPYSGSPVTNSVQTSGGLASFTDMGAGGLDVKLLVSGFSAASYKWRTRVKYSPATAFTGQVYGPWRYMTQDGKSEGGFRAANRSGTPPSFTTQPAGQTVAAPATATFTIAATGNPAPTYQWQRYIGNVWTNVSGTFASYTTLATVPGDNGAQFRCVATNAAGSVNSNIAVLTVQFAPIVTAGPNGMGVVAPAGTSFAVTANGNPNVLSYQWRRGAGSPVVWTDINGATAASYSIASTTPADNGAQFSVAVWNSLNPNTPTISPTAALAVQWLPQITAQPSNQSVTAGATATFTVTANGNPSSLGYQWQKFVATAFANLSGANSASYNLITVQTDSGSRFRVLVTNPAGTTYSAEAVLSVSTLLTRPNITVDPVSDTAIAPQAAVFSAAITGNPTPVLRWQRNGVDIPGATGNSYRLDTTRATDNGAVFRIIATNSQGIDTSANALLTVFYLPAINEQPRPITVTMPATATFTVTASAANPLPAYQWQRFNGSWANITGAAATAASYTTPATVVGDNGAQFRCVVSNTAGSVTSNAAILTVLSMPFFTTQPADQTAVTPAAATFAAVAGGNPAATYRWLRLISSVWTDIPGATAASYTLTTTSPSDNGAQFYCVSTNSLGSVGSNTATLNAQYAPVITSNPANATVAEGAVNTVFSVTANANPGPLSYQWRRNGGDIAATGASYTLPAAAYTNNGEVYSVIVYNSIGSALSAAALLTVNYRPRFTTQPQNQNIVTPDQAVFSVAVNANPNATYQWQRRPSGGGWTNIPGTTGATYTIDSTTTADSGASFRCAATNLVGSDTSLAAVLLTNTPLAAPVFTSDPQSRTVIVPASVSFSVAASGNPSPAFQWQRGGVDIPGATGNSYSLPTTAISDNGANFRVIAANGQSPPDTSATAVLTIQYPPSISTQPAPVTAVPGTQASFTITATGNPAPAYQWQRYNTTTSWTNIALATAAGYTTALVSAADNGAQFRCVATNGAGTATSNPAVLTVEFAPTIIQQPSNQIVTELGTAAFTAAASGSPVPTYQWQRYNSTTLLWGNIANETLVSYTLSPVQVADNGAQFRILAANSRGNATSNPATLTVQYAPRISTQPVNRTVSDGSSTAFSVVATGNPSPTYQWLRNGTIIAGAAQSSYTTPILTMADSGSVYSVSVQNGIGSPVVSNGAVLTVTRNLPAITSQPADATVNEGQAASFTVAASGSSPLSYQWRRGTGSPVAWGNISLANGAGYTTPATTPADSGAAYSCVVSNPAGTATSASALLRVNRVLIAPTITNTNLNAAGTISIAFTYAITASGTAPITYGAQGLPAGLTVNSSNGVIAGTPTLTGTSNVTLTAQNAGGQAPDKTLSLIISASPVAPILNSPLTANGRVSQPFTYTITASGTQPIDFGATNLPAGLTLPSPQTGVISGTPTLAAISNVILSGSNQAGSASNQTLVLTIDPAYAAPVITTDLPVGITVTEPQAATFSITATGVPVPTYQWRRNGTDILGANAPTYALNPTATSDGGARFQVNVTNSVGTAASRVCSLTVNPAPVAPMINSQPASRTATVGQSVSFTVQATGTAPLNYQWQYSLNGSNWAAAPGAVNSSSYTLDSVRIADAGMYRVTISNSGGSANSAVAVLTVNRPRVDAPQPNPPGGSFSSPPLGVTLRVDSVGAVIRYTRDDSDPNSTSLIYSSPIQITSATTINARGFRPDLDSSPVMTATYTPAGQTERPAASPPDSTFTGSIIVSLTTSTDSAGIHYTLDGSRPSISSPLYTVPFTLSATTTVKAFAVASGLAPSDTLIKFYRLVLPPSQVVQPTATPPGRRFWNPLGVTLSSATDSAEIRYTLDGSNPTATSTLYNPAQPPMISSSTILKALAMRTGWITSAILTENYVKAPGPLSSVPARDTTFDNSLGIALSLPGGQTHPIYYTLDGSAPIDGQFRKKSTALQYPGSTVTLSQSATMLAVAVDTLQNPPVPSDTVTRFYTKNSGQLPPPSASPAGQYFQDTVLVALRASDSTVVIRYTIDGNIPNQASSPYTQPLQFDNTTILQAIATKSGSAQSPILFETYILSPDTPIATPRGGQYFDTVYVALSSSSRRAGLFYTLDGSNPSPATATPYAGTPIRLTQSATLKAIAAAGNFSSPVRQETYNIAQRGDTILVPGGSYVPGGGYSFYNPGANTVSARIVLAPPNSVTSTGIDAIPFAILLSPAVENYPFPRLFFSKPSSDARWLYRIGTDGRTYFVTNADTATLIDSGTYFLGNDTMPPTVTLLSQSFDPGDSTVVSLRIDDNIAIIFYSLQRSDDASYNIPQTTINTPYSLSVKLKNNSGIPDNLGLSVNTTDRKNSVRFPPGSGFRLLSQRLSQAQSPPLYHIGESRSYPWDLVSFPVESDTQPTFGALQSLNNMPDFLAVEFNPSTAAYVDQISTSRIYAGKGYWMRSSGTFSSLRLPPLTLRAPASTAGVDLDNGWNLIGNPRPGPLYWPHTRNDTARYLLDSVKALWAWDHALQDYVKAPDSLPMVPWRGYFVYSLLSTRVTLSPTRVLGKAGGNSPFSGPTYRLELEYGRRNLELGLASFAQTGLGVEDEFSLPSLGLRRTFASLRQGRKLMADYLPLRRDTISTWRIAVQNPDPLAVPEPLRVAALSLPPDFEAWVVSPSRRLKYPLSLSGLPSFMPAPGADTMLIIAGTAEALRKSGLLEGKTDGLPGYGLRLVPMGRGFLLELDLPAQAKLEGRLVDLKGRTVGELSSRWLGAGHHVFSFAKHFRAKETPARGVYFLQLRYRGDGAPAQSAKAVQITD